MPKQKIIPELEAEIAAKERQLAQLQHKQQQLENRRSYYEKGDRRKRAHRLITRGAAIESVEPLAKVLCGKSVCSAGGQKSAHVRRQRPQRRRAERKGIIYRAISFSCDADQAQRWAVSCGVRRLPFRRKAAQRVLR